MTDADQHTLATNTYNPSGQVISQEDGAGNTTKFSYTTTSSGLAETDVTAPDGGITSFLYGGGVMLESVSPLGTTTYGYDVSLQPSRVTDPLGNTGIATYDNSGNILSYTDPRGQEQQWSYQDPNELLTYEDGNKNTTAYTYNSMDEPTSVTDPSGGEQTFSYNPAGQLTSSVAPDGNVSGATASQFTTTYTYNSAGELATQTDPRGNTTSYTYDATGYPLTVNGPAGNQTITYTAGEQVQSVTAPGGAVTKYGYDPAGNLATLTDPDQNAWTYSYDGDNRVDKVTGPLGNTVSYGYDGDGNMNSSTDARGITTSITYSTADEPAKISYSDSTPAVSYGYDADGHVTAITDGTGIRKLTYDPAGNLSADGGFTYGYDGDNHVSSVTYPDKTAVSYGYNTDEQLSSLSVGSARTTYSYDADGNLSSTSNSNGVTETRSYNDAAQLTGIKDATSAATLDSYGLTLNAVGQPATVAVTQDGKAQPTWYYGYSSAGQLASACDNPNGVSACSTAAGGGETAWTYDPAGNMLTQASGGASTTYSYNVGEELTKAVTGSAATTYGYDTDGNLTSDGTNTYTYNGAGELSQAVTSTGTRTYGYDAAGNLTSTRLNGSLQQGALWDENGSSMPAAAEDTSSSGATTADYTYGPSGLAAMTTPSGSYTAVTDWLGSVTGLVNSSGTQAATTAYAPYGTPSTTDNVAGTPASSIGYAGSYTLPGGTGLDYMRARSYDPATGGFTSIDPLQAVTDAPYAYASGNPVTYTDPTGMGCVSGFGWFCSHWRGIAQGAVDVTAVAGIGLCAAATEGGCVLLAPIVTGGAGDLNTWIGGGNPSLSDYEHSFDEGFVLSSLALTCGGACAATGLALIGGATVTGAGVGISDYLNGTQCASIGGALEAGAIGAANNEPFDADKWMYAFFFRQH